YLVFFADASRIPPLPVVDAVRALPDIDALAENRVAQLSTGQNQRLQLARILLHDPQVLILDEPASDLDPRARIEIRDLLLDLKGLGKTILLSSHILSELSDVCTSIGIIERGEIVVSGPIEEIAQRLAEQRAAAALGHPPGAPGGNVHPAPGGGTTQPGGGMAPPPAPLPSRVRLRILGDPTAAAHALTGGPGIATAEVVGPAVAVGYWGDESKIAEMVAHLVHRGFGVVGVEPERTDLERIFLEATAHPSGYQAPPPGASAGEGAYR
ncbi:MAG: ATP-binding cassette domain-containing protein, partial [Myxococcota bacterium]